MTRRLVVVLALVGCGTPDPGPLPPIPVPELCRGAACQTDADCPGHERCEAGNGTCMLLGCGRADEICDRDEVCEPGLRCDRNRCVAGESSWADPCRLTDSCRVFGKCTTLQGVCQAWTDADCEGSEGCRDWGECSAGDLPRDTPGDPRVQHRTCWPSEPCDQALGTEGVNACADVGLCTPTGGRCLASDVADCQASAACTGNGACDLKDGECWREVTDGAECASGGVDQDVCSSFGFCALVDGACNATEDTHCAGSYLCQTWGECFARDGECWARP